MTNELIRKRRVAVTAEEVSPGVPYWGPNQNITDIPEGDTDVAIENLIAGRRYYVKTWTEDMYGTRSNELLRVVDTPPDATVPAVPENLTLTAGAFGFKASWDPVADADLAEYELAYAPDNGSTTGADEGDYVSLRTRSDSLRVDQEVGQQTWVRVRSIDFSGNFSAWTEPADVTPYRIDPLIFGGPGIFDDGSPMRVFVKVPDDVSSIIEVNLTLAFREFFAADKDAVTSGTLTSSSGGGSTSGASSASTSGDTTQTYGLSSGNGLHRHVDSVGGNTDFYAGHDQIDSLGSHHHTMAHTHTTPNHSHSIPGHTHDINYGTFEETYPASHSVTVRTYKRIGGGWTLEDTQTGITDDLADLDLTGVIVGPGDWRIEVQSEAAQPNSGRLGVDVYGSILAVIGGSGVISAEIVSGDTYLNGALFIGGVEVFDDTGALLVGAAPTGAAGGQLGGSYPNPTVNASHSGSTHAATQAAAEATAAAALTTHEAASDPHPGYLTPTEGDAAYQPLDATLTALAGLATGADKMPYSTGTDAFAQATLTSAGRALIDDADAAAQRTTLGLGSFATISSLAHSATTGITATDHHAAPAAGPDADVTVDAAGAAGTASTFARSGHGHKLTTSNASPVDTDATAASAGTSTTAPSRGDHRHQLGSHGAASHDNITRKFFLGPEDATLDGATFATLGASPDLTRVIAYADGATQGAHWSFMVPADWASGGLTVVPVWSPGATDGTAHTVRWSFKAKKMDAGSTVTAAGTTTTFTGDSAARTVDVLVYETGSSMNVTPAAAGDLQRIEVRRIGADAADTYVGVVNLLGLIVSYTATQ